MIKLPLIFKLRSILKALFYTIDLISQSEGLIHHPGLIVCDDIKILAEYFAKIAHRYNPMRTSCIGSRWCALKTLLCLKFKPGSQFFEKNSKISLNTTVFSKSHHHFRAPCIGAKMAASVTWGSLTPVPNALISYLLIPVLGVILWLPATAHGDDAGTALATRVYNSADGNDAASRAHMVLTQKGHKPRYRKLYTYRLDGESGETLTLLRFTEPADIKDTGLLTYNYPSKDNNQWIYLPALDRARRIAASRKGGRFVGSDLYYEDLQRREVSEDRHRILGVGKVGQVPTTVLESVPVDPDNSVYSKRVSWIHEKSLIPLRIDFYKAGNEKAMKRLKATKIKKIQGYWTVVDSRMTDLKSGHQTRMLTKAIVYDQSLPDSLFSRRALSDESHEEKYRP